ncbi:DIE2/ALG10 family-domain-containing protein [Bombardia bombarda]|uniref:Dol-P-Glc:Glc(2)Man(9)GlcNAc(2)-PP-Dol alpha-1,2-glucosyltransferase n=1 Tax=Bombardia bombarda TaxID=252184 RepID=A0AA39X935_9PEZI|nr:DIE2/ALG10 family-domain-containing protein [Bombardia bombarda]
MEAIQVVRDSITFRELFLGLVAAGLLARVISSRPTEATKVGGFFFVFVFARSWLALVDHHVPEPYLDEFFHIPQAQVYCDGRYLEWDDKITTPPGLYLLSVAYHKLFRIAECTAHSLRSYNLLATLLTSLFAAICRNQIEARTAERDGNLAAQAFSLYSYHTALNIALFPVLFFFSALYYTDVASTLLVLVAYANHLRRVAPEAPGLLNSIWTVALGIGALFMRQTNVFWVVVYMGGLEVVHVVRSLHPESVKTPRFLTLAENVLFYARRYAEGYVHDPPLHMAWPDDWFFCLLSIAIAAVCNPVKVLRQVWPHVTVLILFAGFVVWNGGVVLGDKSNHVATIHLAQMLYIWPFFAFFSAPLLIPSLLPLVEIPTRIISRLIYGTAANTSSFPLTEASKSKPTRPDTTRQSLAFRMVDLFFLTKIYYIPYLVGTLVLSLAIVKYNTIIHPFTLADNRHYMFYIFRYTILHSIRRRYWLVAAYTLSRLLVWTRLAGSLRQQTPFTPSSTGSSARYINHPFLSREMQAAYTSATVAKPVPTSGKTTYPNVNAAVVLGTLDEPNSHSTAAPSTSTALLWLLATSLSLVTAPLVEPRYFILPWVFYRLLVPAWSLARQYPSAAAAAESTAIPSPKWVYSVGRRVDLTLALETVWFVAINLGTMYMFVSRPFYWKNASTGEMLDGGRVQRFMW